MSDKKPNSRRNLDIAIDRIIGIDTNPLQIRTLLANTIIGQLLPNGVVKGGSALKLRYGDKTTRFTRDLDTARSDALEVFLERLQTALQDGWNGFTGRIIQKEPAKPVGIPGEYIMQPFEIKLSYNGKSWVTVPLEIGHDEIGDTTTYDSYISHEVISLFEKLGFPAPKPVALLKIHHQIAQKLHALSIIGSERAHDLIDLQVIIKNEKIDYPLTKTVCERLFISRKQQNWPPFIIKGKGWDTLYESQINGLDVFQSVDEAIIWGNDLISEIINAV
jgi:hypothetical protein